MTFNHSNHSNRPNRIIIKILTYFPRSRQFIVWNNNLCLAIRHTLDRNYLTWALSTPRKTQPIYSGRKTKYKINGTHRKSQIPARSAINKTKETKKKQLPKNLLRMEEKERNRARERVSGAHAWSPASLLLNKTRFSFYK